MHCRKDSPERDFAEYLEAPGVLGIDAFRYSLDWLLEMNRRYGKPAFSLIGLRVEHVRPATGVSEASGPELVDALMGRIIETVREADRCTRTREDMLWLLMPYTDSKALLAVQQRLGNLLDPRQAVPLDIGLRMTGISAPMDLRIHEDADLLMERVAGKLN